MCSHTRVVYSSRSACTHCLLTCRASVPVCVHALVAALACPCFDCAAFAPALLQVVRVELDPDVQASSSSAGGPCLLLPEPEAIADAPEWAKPNRSWVQQFVTDFQHLRMQVQQAYEQQGVFAC